MIVKGAAASTVADLSKIWGEYFVWANADPDVCKHNDIRDPAAHEELRNNIVTARHR